jgi:putative membrane protein
VPHFYAISLFRKEEYEAAGFQILPTRKGIPATRLRIVLWTLLLVPVSLSLIPLGVSGWVYGAVALASGLGLLLAALTGQRRPDWARRYFLGTLLYMTAVTGSMVVDALATRLLTSSEALATLNAGLNGLSALCIIGGGIAIRRKNITAHWKLMVSAFGASTLFLIGYLTRMFMYGSKHFTGTGTLRSVYFVILISHMILAAVVVPGILAALYQAARKQFSRHRWIARITYPVWLYVSLTGVAVYWMLYRI